MDNRYAISTYPDVDEVNRRLDQLIGMPIYSIKPDVLKRYEEEYYEKKCAKSKAKDNYRRHVLVKAPHDAELGVLLGTCARGVTRRPGINIAIDIDAYDLL